MRAKFSAFFLSALLCTFAASGVMASAPAPYTTAAPPAAAPTPATPVAPTAAASEAAQLALVLEEMRSRIKRCAELQDRSVRITCYDNLGIDLGFVTPDRLKNEEVSMQKIGFWQMSEKTAADGIKSTYMRVESNNTVASKNGTERQVAFVIKCTPGKTDAFLDWKAPVIEGIKSASSATQLINYYTDGKTKSAENWEISTDKQALFAPDAIAFIRNLMKNNKLTFEFASYGNAVQSAHFDIKGIDAVVDTIVKACY